MLVALDPISTGGTSPGHERFTPRPATAITPLGVDRVSTRMPASFLSSTTRSLGHLTIALSFVALLKASQAPTPIAVDRSGRCSIAGRRTTEKSKE
jgi:hypothetical protein